MQTAGMNIEQRSPLPLAAFPVVRTDDEEEGRQAVCRIYQEVKLRRCTPGRPLGFTGNHVNLGGWGISYAEYQSGFELISAPSSDAYIVQFCTHGSGQTRYGKHAVDLVPNGAAAVVSPHERPGWTFSDRFAHFIVKIDKVTLDKHVQALTGQAGSHLEFDTVAPNEGSLAGPLRRLIYFIASELSRDDTLLRSHVVLADFENAIVNGMLMRQSHSLAGRWPTRMPSLAESHVRKAEEYLAARLGHPIRMTEVADEIGVGLRSLQREFRRQRGLTITQFLRSARLDLARKRLSAGLPGTMVTHVALDCGFAHLGKFAAYYRKQFGESPSETLARADKANA